MKSFSQACHELRFRHDFRVTLHDALMFCLVDANENEERNMVDLSVCFDLFCS